MQGELWESLKWVFSRQFIFYFEKILLSQLIVLLWAMCVLRFMPFVIKFLVPFIKYFVLHESGILWIMMYFYGHRFRLNIDSQYFPMYVKDFLKYVVVHINHWLIHIYHWLIWYFIYATSLSLSLSLSHTHTHTHARTNICMCVSRDIAWLET